MYKASCMMGADLWLQESTCTDQELNHTKNTTHTLEPAFISVQVLARRHVPFSYSVYSSRLVLVYLYLYA